MNPAESGIAAGTVLFGKYQVESILGRGGMGLVYCARHIALDERVAIKVLRSDVALDDETVTRFVREAQAAVRLKSEHVARISDVGTFDDGLPYMVMEFLQGADLGQMIDGNGAMPVPYAVDLVLQACDAIAEAHSLGIVHRDIKPTNLFVSSRPDQSTIVKVLDFGISKSANGADLSLTQTSSMLGTPAYMSPEQMRSARTVDVRTDIWSLGTVLYELVEGRRPFLAESFSEMCVMVAVDPPLPMQRGGGLEPLLHKCLAKNPEHRYANVAELTRDLALFAGNPDAARHYVTRAHRVLGLQPPADSQLIFPRPSYASNVMAAANAAPSMAMPAQATGNVKVSTGSRRIWIALAAVAIGVVGAFGIIRATSKRPTVDEPPSANHGTELGSATGSETAATGSSVPNLGSATPGSAAAGSASPGSAAAATAGSAAAAVGSAADAGSGGSGARGSAEPVTTKPIPRPRPRPIPKPTPKPPPQIGSGAQKGSGAGSAKPPCDPFGSRRGC